MFTEFYIFIQILNYSWSIIVRIPTKTTLDNSMSSYYLEYVSMGIGYN